MPNLVTLKSSDSASSLTLSDAEHAESSEWADYFVATLEDDGLRASAQVYAFHSEALVELLDDLARHWKGFDETKRWSSVEEHLALACTSDGLGHTFMDITLRKSLYDRDWSAEGSLRVDAGQLDEIARQTRRFLLRKEKAV